MATVYRVLGQVNPAAATLTTLYTVPGATTAIISTITIAHLGTVMATYRLAIRPNGAAIDPKHYIAYDVTLAAGTAQTATIGLTLDAADVVSVYASSTDVAFGAFGSEIS